MGTVPTGTGQLRRMEFLVRGMFLPVERSITVSAPQRMAQSIFWHSAAGEEVSEECPILAFIFTRNSFPIIIGSDSGWLMLAGRIARPRAISSRTTRAARPFCASAVPAPKSDRRAPCQVSSV